MRDCPFCPPPAERVILETPDLVAIWDAFPVSPGHALIVPRRHVADWFAATDEERRALADATVAVRAIIEERWQPDGYNIGVNAGATAGQTVDHLHVHVIPRYAGDVEQPRGGVRGVIPGKADYKD